jgi:GNAT superfamily N-acetyltransferase
MYSVNKLASFPENFDTFRGEIAAGLERLYGQRAAMDYAEKAATNLRSNLGHPSVLALGAWDGPTLAGILLGVQRGRVFEISFLHVLAVYEGRGVESALVGEAVRVFREAGIDEIIMESVTFCAVDLVGVFLELGFEHVPRQLMMAPVGVGSGEDRVDAAGIRGVERDEWVEVAGCVVDAYGEHPDLRLHADVRNVIDATEFILRVTEGNFGTFQRGYALGHWGEEGCLGAIFGCEIVAGVGFVLQVVVRRGWQNQGIGNGLLQSLFGAFSSAGLEKVALGVTQSSDACRLYARHGFEVLSPVDAFTWQRGR